MMDAAALTGRARAITLQLVGWPSVTGTAGETAFSQRLAGLLREIPYFRAHPEQVILQPIPGDALGRANVVAIVRGEGRRGVGLCGHFDTVPVDDYGSLEPLAFTPDALRPAMIERLRASGLHPLALADLESGAFLPGRGALDMKSGLAAGIAVLERFADLPDRHGSLVLIATPDEEDRSAGMRAAAAALPQILSVHGLDLQLAINLDALCDNGDGTDGQVVALGCIGKLLLSALVVGKETHACYPADGVNAAFVAAELVSAFELAPELGEEAGDEVAAPPTVLGSRDLKAVYNVTTPARSWATWNVLTQRRPAAEVLAIARRLTEAAVEGARRRLAGRVARQGAGTALGEAWGSVPVVSFAELMAAARERDPAFQAAFDARAALAADQATDFPGRCRILTELAWEASGLAPPAIVLGFASLPYPAVEPAAGRAQEELAGLIRAAVAEVAARCGTAIRVVRQMPVIVDMSFLGPVDATDLEVAAASTPIWGSSIRWDIEHGATPGCPTVNIGPWGRDYHHWQERANERYTFEVLPVLVAEVATRVLRAG